MQPSAQREPSPDWIPQGIRDEIQGAAQVPALPELGDLDLDLDFFDAAPPSPPAGPEPR